MGVIYRATERTARMNVVKTAIDAGSGPGTLEIGTAAMAAVLATITLTDPCGSVAGDVLTLTMPHSVAAAGTGTAAAARIKDSDGNIIASGLTVGTSATNVILDSASITSGQTVTITAATVTHNTSGV